MISKNKRRRLPFIPSEIHTVSGFEGLKAVTCCLVADGYGTTSDNQMKWLRAYYAKDYKTCDMIAERIDAAVWSTLHQWV